MGIFAQILKKKQAEKEAVKYQEESIRAAAAVSPLHLAMPFVPADWRKKKDPFEKLAPELIERILYFSKYQVMQKHKLSCDPLPGERILGKDREIFTTDSSSATVDNRMTLHSFNALAATSKKWQAVVEDFTTHLYLPIYNSLSKNNKRKIDIRCKQEKRMTNRSIWLEHVSTRCAFCGLLNQSQKRKCTSLLKGSPFNNNILCCAGCEAREWPEQISLENAADKYGIPISLLSFPKMVFTRGRYKNFDWQSLWSVTAEQVETGGYLQPGNCLIVMTVEAGVPRQLMSAEQGIVNTVLEEEVRKYQKMVHDEPAEHVPHYLSVPCLEKNWEGPRAWETEEE